MAQEKPKESTFGYEELGERGTDTKKLREMESGDPTAWKDAFLERGTVAPSKRVVVGLMKCEEIDVIVDWLREKYKDKDMGIDDRGTFWYIDAMDEIVFDFSEIEPLIGRGYNVYDFLVNLTTTIGRGYTLGDKFIMTNVLMGIEEGIPVSEDVVAGKGDSSTGELFRY